MSLPRPRHPQEGAAPARPAGAGAVPAALVSGSLLLVSGLAYVVTVLAARALTPQSYGELAALLGVLLVGSVPATGLQTAAALHLGRHPASAVARAVPRLHATALAASVAVGLVALAAVPLVVSVLRLPGAAGAVWLAVALVPQTLVGGYDGILQGTGRHGRLAAVFVSFGGLKWAGAVTGLLAGGTPAAALAGMAAGCAAGALVSWLGCGRPGVSRGLRGPARSAARAAGALLGLVLLVNLDLLLARHHLPAAQAGEYAVGAVFAKVAYWLPQGVGVVLLPRLADPASRRQALPAALGVVAAVGGLLTLATAVLGAAALPLVGGAAYGAHLGGWTWVFTAAGTLLALAQLLLYNGIAAADRTAAAAVWATVAVETAVVGALAAAGVLSVLAVAAVAAGTATALVGVGLLRLRRAHAPDVAVDAQVAGAAVSGAPVAAPAPPARRRR
ncbi:lipopolysaccharide biosynthesis protein [Geodermatophilus nigrescens]|uniref:Membrane protein involved in the export of O-antigen and teichoic acid n=1 Tax=Geodermatophilus nigrescens TaxID=1070870 RepID=A0A1M5IWH7_9ACTN|nr:polysaccharide biosynthesis protein [Geodermatophilus nigrescens]SHG32698.1 Membrane protein involved in the export of O-antigen and teichoic acid [Geodermatophilus nigrescens]